MTIIGASVCNKNGKAILSRQFREISKGNIEKILLGFPKFINKSVKEQQQQQHTLAEDKKIRYLYQPVEELFIVLISTKESNIIQDIETLYLFLQCLNNICFACTEQTVLANTFELFSAFDEIVNLGLSENLTLSSIRTFLEMDSHEEKIQEIIARNKELEAIEERKRRTKQLELQRREAAKRNALNNSVSNSNLNNANHLSGFSSSNSSPFYIPVRTPALQEAEDSYSRVSSSSNFKNKNKGKGMQLGNKNKNKNKKTSDIVTNARQDLGLSETTGLLDEIDPHSSRINVSDPYASNYTMGRSSNTLNSRSNNTSSIIDNLPHNDGILAVVKESVSGKISRDGGEPTDVELKGDLTLRIADPSLSKIKLKISSDNSLGIQFRTYPLLDRHYFTTQNILTLKDTNKSFPSNNAPLGLVRFRYTPTNGSSQIKSIFPISFITWISPSGEVDDYDDDDDDSTPKYDLTIEYESTSLLGDDTNSDSVSSASTLANVTLFIPLPSSKFKVNSIGDNSDYSLDDEGYLRWTTPEITPGSNGSFAITASADDENDFFPINIKYEKKDPQKSFSKLDIIDIKSTIDDEDVAFTKNIEFVTDNLRIA